MSWKTSWRTARKAVLTGPPRPVTIANYLPDGTQKGEKVLTEGRARHRRLQELIWVRRHCLVNAAREAAGVDVGKSVASFTMREAAKVIRALPDITRAEEWDRTHFAVKGEKP